MSALVGKVARDGQKNAAVFAAGIGTCSEAWEKLVDIKNLKDSPDKVKIDAIYYACSDRVEIQLAWEGEEEVIPLWTLGGRGRIDFGEVSGLSNLANKPTGNILARVLGAMEKSMYAVILDLSKHTGAPT